MIIASITVTTRFEEVPNRLRGEQPTSGEVFWKSLPRSQRREISLSVADEERRFRQRFQKSLGEILGRLVLPTKRSFRVFDEEPNLDLIPVIAVKVVEIHYGSLKFGLDFPDVDSVLEMFGNNSEVLAAVLETYIPQAFYDSEGIQSDLTGLFGFDVNVTPPFVQYAAQRAARVNKGLPAIASDAKTRGAAIIASIIRSSVIFPVLLVMFLWYFNRQDTLAERQMQNDLIKTILQQQTAVLEVLKDALIVKKEAPTVAPPANPEKVGSK